MPLGSHLGMVTFVALKVGIDEGEDAVALQSGVR